MVSCSYLHYNVIQRGREAISGKRYKITRNRLAYMLDYFVMQMRKANHDKALRPLKAQKAADHIDSRNRKSWKEALADLGFGRKTSNLCSKLP